MLSVISKAGNSPSMLLLFALIALRWHEIPLVASWPLSCWVWKQSAEDQEEARMEKDNKCAHENCTCQRSADNKYCSAYCESAKDQPGAPCECGHPGCRAEAKAPMAKAS